MKNIVGTYRAILREIRLLRLQDPVRQDVLGFLSSQFKKHQLTEEKYCRANQSAIYLAQTYLTMLQSSRQSQALHEQYGGRGERTTEQAANLVGLTSLPKSLS